MLISFFVLSVTFTGVAHPGGFDLSEQDPTEVVELPGKNMRGGMFIYYFDKKYSDGRVMRNRTRKAGLLVNNKLLYYAHTGAEGGGMLDPGGDCNFGVYKNYFLMDCWSYGASHNRLMYLFTFGKDTPKLLDVIGGAGMDFISYAPEAKKPGFQRLGYRLPLWMEIKDMDGDGKPEIKFSIYIYSSYDFDLYIHIKDDKLLVNYNQALYEPLFEAEKKKNKSGKKTDAFYFYGLLSGRLKLSKIKNELRHEKEHYTKIMPLLEKCDKRYDLPHYFDTAPALVEYKLNER